MEKNTYFYFSLWNLKDENIKTLQNKDIQNFDTKESNILGHSGTIYLDDNIFIQIDFSNFLQ